MNPLVNIFRPIACRDLGIAQQVNPSPPSSEYCSAGSSELLAQVLVTEQE